MLGGVGYKAAYGLLYDGSIVWQRVREQHNGAWKAHSDILRVDWKSRGRDSAPISEASGKFRKREYGILWSWAYRNILSTDGGMWKPVGKCGRRSSANIVNKERSARTGAGYYSILTRYGPLHLSNWTAVHRTVRTVAWEDGACPLLFDCSY